MSRIDELYAKYFKRLIRALGGTPDADDIAQEAMIARWKRAEDPENDWAYLVASARNAAKKRATRANVPRHGGGLLTQLEDEQDAHDETRSAEANLIRQQEIARFRADFNAVMAELSPDTRQALVLRRRGLGSKEIAESLGLTDQAVRSRLSRAMSLLRERLSPPPGVDWLDLLGDDDDHER